MRSPNANALLLGIVLVGLGCPPKLDPRPAAPRVPCDSQGLEVRPADVTPLGFQASDVVTAWQRHQHLDVRWPEDGFGGGLATQVAAIDSFRMTTKMADDLPTVFVENPTDVHSCSLPVYLRVPVRVFLEASDGSMTADLGICLIAPSLDLDEWIVRACGAHRDGAASDVFVERYLADVGVRLGAPDARLERLTLTLYDPGDQGGSEAELTLRTEVRWGDGAGAEEWIRGSWLLRE